MADDLTKAQRSMTMSHIRSRWTDQEKKVHAWLSLKGIKHNMHPELEGRPDMLLTKSRCVVFLNGCFWHGCPKCYVKPKSNVAYWLPKIEATKLRDKKAYKLLKSAGWEVKVLWEHQLKSDFEKTCSRLL